jgi:hypothetical protein
VGAGSGGLSLYAPAARDEVELLSQAAATAVRGCGSGAAGPATLANAVRSATAADSAADSVAVALDGGSTCRFAGAFHGGRTPFEAPLATLQDFSRRPAAYLAERHVIGLSRVRAG